MTKNLLIWLDHAEKEDVHLIGEKAARMGEMSKAGFPVPSGFVVTTLAYHEFVKGNHLDEKIKHLLGHVDYTNTASIKKASSHIRKEIEMDNLSEDLVHHIFKAYEKLGNVLHHAFVSVRPSATTKESPFIEKQETVFNVEGEANLLMKIKEMWASFFSADALLFRHQENLDHFKGGVAILVEKTADPDISGTMFTRDPQTNDKSRLVIEAMYGLRQPLSQDVADYYEIDKHTLAVLHKEIKNQTTKLVRDGFDTKDASVSFDAVSKQKLPNSLLTELAHLGKKIEDHYYFPQEVEWIIEKGNIYILQVKPLSEVTTIKKDKESSPPHEKKQLLTGSPGSPGIASGPIKFLFSQKDAARVAYGDVLVMEHAHTDFAESIKKAAALIIVQNQSLYSSDHILATHRIPSVVGATDAQHTLQEGMVVTVNGLTGEISKSTSSVTLTYPTKSNEQVHTATKVYVAISEVEKTREIATHPVDGVGILQAEPMIQRIGVHPKKIIRDGKRQEFVDSLAKEIAAVCAAFSPRPVIYKLSDFTTSAYRQLVGGSEFEPHEQNPLLGFHGTYRFTHDQDMFELELAALQQVRNSLGHKNLWLILPFVRSVTELHDVKKMLSDNNLYRSPTFKLWMMVETPSVAVSLEKYIEQGVDGVCIGEHLATLVLGIDRDDSEMTLSYNDGDPSVLWTYEQVIKTAHRHKIASSICVPTPRHPSFFEDLIALGITSITVSEDAIHTSREHIARFEKELLTKNHG